MTNTQKINLPIDSDRQIQLNKDNFEIAMILSYQGYLPGIQQNIDEYLSLVVQTKIFERELNPTDPTKNDNFKLSFV